MNYCSIPLSDIDLLIPEGKLREKYAYSYTNENEEVINVTTPTWRQALDHINPNIVMSSRRRYKGVWYIIFADSFSNLTGENRAAKDIGANHSQPSYTLWEQDELQDYGWDEITPADL